MGLPGGDLGAARGELVSMGQLETPLEPGQDL